MSSSALMFVLACCTLPPQTCGIRQHKENFKDMEEHLILDLGADARNLTSLFSESADGPKYKVLADEKKYMCCCTIDPEDTNRIACQLKDVDSQKANWWMSGCGGHMGSEWHSWYNVKRNEPAAAELYGAGSCMVSESKLPDVLTSTTTVTTTVTTTTTTITTTVTTLDPGPTIVNFGQMKYKKIDGVWNKCCCHSDVVSDPDASTEIVCKLHPVKSVGNTYTGTWLDVMYAEGHVLVGCKELGGPGHHSWNNMPKKYADLKHYNECAIP